MTAVLQSLTRGVWFDESVRLERIHWAGANGEALDLPTLFVDDYTVMSEVRVLTRLVAGDHCVVSINLLHMLYAGLDRLVFELASWEVRSVPAASPKASLSLRPHTYCVLQALPVKLHHHFILLDSVADVTADGPVNAAGEPVRVAEYSDSFPNAWRRLCPGHEFPHGLWVTGARSLLANLGAVLTEPARMHAPLLLDYVPHLQTVFIYVI